jgi:hypothetical protein
MENQYAFYPSCLYGYFNQCSLGFCGNFGYSWHVHVKEPSMTPDTKHTIAAYASGSAITAGLALTWASTVYGDSLPKAALGTVAGFACLTLGAVFSAASTKRTAAFACAVLTAGTAGAGWLARPATDTPKTTAPLTSYMQAP